MWALRIVIVNWNAGSHLARCVQSIASACGPGVSLEAVVVVDNASKDGSADALEAPGIPLQVVRNPVNRGFGAACNQGAIGSRADFLLFLNPDTTLTPAMLSIVCEAAAAPKVGVVGAQLVDASGMPRRCTARFPTPRRILGQSLGLDRFLPRQFPPHYLVEWPHDKTREVDQVMGAFFLVPRDVFERLGGFDERYFVYYEEVDFCRRARDAGLRTVFVAEARAFHFERGTTSAIPATRLFYILRSRLAYARKHFGRLGVAVTYLATLVIEPVTRAFYVLLAGPARMASLGALASAYWRLWRSALGPRAAPLRAAAAKGENGAAGRL